MQSNREMSRRPGRAESLTREMCRVNHRSFAALAVLLAAVPPMTMDYRRGPSSHERAFQTLLAFAQLDHSSATQKI